MSRFEQSAERAEIALEVWRPAIAVSDGAEMLAYPGLRTIDSHVFDELVPSAEHRHRQPRAAASGCLDPIAAAPVTNRVLDVVEEHEGVYLVDEIEEAAPWQVAWLDDTDCTHVRAVAAPERRSSSPVHAGCQALVPLRVTVLP